MNGRQCWELAQEQVPVLEMELEQALELEQVLVQEQVPVVVILAI